MGWESNTDAKSAQTISTWEGKQGRPAYDIMDSLLIINVSQEKFRPSFPGVTACLRDAGFRFAKY